MAKAPDVTENTLSTLRESIHSHQPWEELKPKLLTFTQHDLEKEDDCNLNILHHAIQSNYAEVVHYLLLRGYFMELQQPSKIPYLHLACIHGHATIVNLLMQERPNDFPPGLPQQVESGQLPNLAEILSKPLTSLKCFSPLDLAAASQEIRCVQLLLSDEHQYGSMLERAVKHGSTECVKFLLREDKTICQFDMNKAFKLALIRKLSGCLDLLLSEGVQVDQVLNTMNPYHVMYMYSSGFQLHPVRNEGLADCTDVLIKYGLDVNAAYPSGSYPLYSLIHSLIEEKDYDPAITPTSHIKALESLLKAGADPNLDEEFLAECKYNLDSDFLFSFSLGRDTCTSALNALFVAIEQSDHWDRQSPEFYTRCLELILEYGADASTLNRYGNAPLHDLMKSLAVQHAQGRYTDMLGPVFALLKYGADLNIKSSQSLLPMLPVSYYFSELLKSFPVNNGDNFSNWCESPSSCHIMQLLIYMEPRETYLAYERIMTLFSTHPDLIIMEIFLKTISPLLAQHVFQPRNLLSLCTARVWKSISCSYRNIEYIPVPKLIKNILYKMFER